MAVQSFLAYFPAFGGVNTAKYAILQENYPTQWQLIDLLRKHEDIIVISTTIIPKSLKIWLINCELAV